MNNAFEKKYFEEYEFNGKTFCSYSDFFQKEKPEFLEAVKKKVMKYKTSGKLLDVGCAEGYYLDKFSKNFEVYGIDISEYAVSKAKSLVPEFEKNVFVCSADSNWLFEKNFFDVIIINHTIEHVVNPKKCLHNAFNALKDDGILYLAFPTKLFELPKFIPNYKKTATLINKVIYPLHIGNLRIQFGTDATHKSNPWPWDVANNSFLNPFFEPIEMFPEKWWQKLIAGGYEIVAKKKVIK